MKKYLMFFLILFVSAIAVMSQIADSTTVVVDTTGKTIGEILKANWAVLVFIAYSCLELWLGQTNKLKEGSLLAWIFNLLGKFIKKQLPTVKARFMTDGEIKSVRGLKTIFMLMILSSFTLASYSQGVFSQFTKITRGTSVDLLKGEGDKSVQWYFKPTAELSAMNLVRNKETNKWEGSPFTAAGIGAGIQHYIEHNGVLANDYGFNALFIVNFNDPTNVGFGIAGTANILDFVNAGAGYDFTNKVPLILFGASWKF